MQYIFIDQLIAHVSVRKRTRRRVVKVSPFHELNMAINICNIMFRMKANIKHWLWSSNTARKCLRMLYKGVLRMCLQELEEFCI